MPEHPPHPRKYDAVLGGTTATPSSGLVLGGVDGVKSRLANASVEIRIAAVQQALSYGEAGLDLALAALKDESVEVIRAAYLLLKKQVEPKVQQALKQVNTWQLMKCLWSVVEDCIFGIDVAISSDGQTIISVCEGNTIKMWDINTGHYLRNIELRRLEKELRRLKKLNYIFNSVAISPNGQTIISISSNVRSKEIVKVWDINTGHCLQTIEGDVSIGTSVSISPDGQAIISSSPYNPIKIWDINTGQDGYWLPPRYVICLCSGLLGSQPIAAMLQTAYPARA